MRIGMNKDSVRFDGNSVPLYDRGYSLALTSTDDSNGLEGYNLQFLFCDLLLLDDLVAFILLSPCTGSF